MRLAVLLIAVPLFAGDAAFDDVVRRFESHYGTKRMSIPFMGLANFVCKVARPAGAKDLRLAIFEHVSDRHPSAEQVDDMISSLKAQGWTPFVRVRSNRSRELTMIYARQVHRDHELLLTTFEHDEAVVMRIRINADTLAKWVNHPRLMGRCKGSCDAD